MQRYRINHRTCYSFSGVVSLNPHTLLLRPRESHELRIESSMLNLTPTATLQWHRDVEDNCVAVASFDLSANQLIIESEVVIQQYNDTPLDFMVADYAIEYPFKYTPEDWVVLSPYGNIALNTNYHQLHEWITNFWSGESIQTYTLLHRICTYIHQSLSYQQRETPGVQSPIETLSRGSGTCRDFANLFLETARCLGLASRFVSGYLHSPLPTFDYGATHAWAEVYLPGAGWKGFDPTSGEIAGSNHIAVAVARLPELVPPIAGSFFGIPGASMNVEVRVTEL